MSDELHRRNGGIAKTPSETFNKLSNGRTQFSETLIERIHVNGGGPLIRKPLNPSDLSSGRQGIMWSKSYEYHDENEDPYSSQPFKASKTSNSTSYSNNPSYSHSTFYSTTSNPQHLYDNGSRNDSMKEVLGEDILQSISDQVYPETIPFHDSEILHSTPLKENSFVSSNHQDSFTMREAQLQKQIECLKLELNHEKKLNLKFSEALNTQHSRIHHQELGQVHLESKKKSCNVLEKKTILKLNQGIFLLRQTLKELERDARQCCFFSMNEISNLVLEKCQVYDNRMQQLQEKYEKETISRRFYLNQLQEERGNIRVFCRVRPDSGISFRYPDENCIEIPKINNKNIKTGMIDNLACDSFEFNRVHPPNEDQLQVFESVRHLVSSALDGYNVCIMAYGQTGSGKTHTMEGSINNRGVNYRALEELFMRKKDDHYEFSVSMMQVYNEQIHDLLVPIQQSTSLAITRVNATTNSINVQGLKELKISTLDEVEKVLEYGKRNRTTGSTNLNDQSSRSHSILSVMIKGRKYSSKLHLVDLAGSERVSKSNVYGQLLQETKSINKSLSALGNVIQALLEKKKHVPYRDSKLTYVLSDSLGGNSKVAMFICVRSAVEALGETLCSLQFGKRVSKAELGKAQKSMRD